MREVLVLSFLLAVLAGLAAAQVPTSGNVFVGYSYYDTNLSTIERTSANGWAASFEGKVLPFIGLVADYSDYYALQNFVAITCPMAVQCPPMPNGNVEERNVLFGPRVSARVGKFRPFAEILVGLSHKNISTESPDNSFATAIGGGLDYQLIRLVSWRIQADYVSTQFVGTNQNNVRVSTGIAIHF